MKYFINPENGGFYLTSINAEIPDTAVEISADTYQELHAGQVAGKQIVFGSNGKPKLADPAQQPENLAATIAGRRYQSETAGIIIGGMSVATDRESQGLLNGAALSAFMDDTYVCRWKTPDGFVQLDAKTILAIAKAVRAHVQASFDREEELLEAVKDDTYQPEMLDQGWPA